MLPANAFRPKLDADNADGRSILLLLPLPELAPAALLAPLPAAGAEFPRNAEGEKRLAREGAARPAGGGALFADIALDLCCSLTTSEFFFLPLRFSLPPFFSDFLFSHLSEKREEKDKVANESRLRGPARRCSVQRRPRRHRRGLDLLRCPAAANASSGAQAGANSAHH